MLFDRAQEKSAWEPPAPPDALGELLDSRYMLSVYLPSDPRLLGAAPGKRFFVDEDSRSVDSNLNGRPVSRASMGTRGAMAWRLQSGKLREVGIRTLQWIDGASSTARWYRPVEVDADDATDATDAADDDTPPPPYASDDPGDDSDTPLKVETHLTPTPLTRSRSKRGGKASTDATPVETESSRRLRD